MVSLVLLTVLTVIRIRQVPEVHSAALTFQPDEQITDIDARQTLGRTHQFVGVADQLHDHLRFGELINCIGDAQCYLLIVLQIQISF